MLDISLQNFVYSNPTRLDLLDHQRKHGGIKKRIAVYRNHSFELVEHTIIPYLEFAGYDVEFAYSDYDDSLTFFNLDADSDLLILWLDTTRYLFADVAGFVQERLSYLSRVYKKPVLVSLLGDCFIKTDFLQFPINDIANEMGTAFWDEKREAFTGTKISSKGMLKISKELGLNYIPSMLTSPLKAIVVDLDNTLYSGVLGEDGVQGIHIGEGHVSLQNALLELKKQGVLLAVASKNNAEDVSRLFNENSAFTIKYADFAKVCASWESKSSSIKQISEYCNIGLDSILFIDDNPGELAEVENALPQVKKLLANDDAGITAEVLRNYPGIRRYNVHFEDGIRNSDIRANEKRRQMQSEMSEADYIKSLHMRLTYSVDDETAATRIAELANKTNQFIFSYRRYSLQEIKELMQSAGSAVISVSLKDDLSDSGIIAVFVGKKQNDVLELEECFVSCRALGRGIDELLVKKGIQVLAERFKTKKLQINFTDGERNVPARKFVNDFLKAYENKIDDWQFACDESLVHITVKI